MFVHKKSSLPFISKKSYLKKVEFIIIAFKEKPFS